MKVIKQSSHRAQSPKVKVIPWRKGSILELFKVTCTNVWCFRLSVARSNIEMLAGVETILVQHRQLPCSHKFEETYHSRCPKHRFVVFEASSVPLSSQQMNFCGQLPLGGSAFLFLRVFNAVHPLQLGHACPEWVLKAIIYLQASDCS